MIRAGRSFFKMSGSGNDFVMIDARHEPAGRLAEADVVRRICARGTGVGADGVVFLEASDRAAVRLVYLNADGGRADFCGNATLCTTRLSTEMGIGAASGLSIETDAGIVQARITADGLPEIDLPQVTEVAEDASGIERQERERRIGFALVGVPHLTVLCDDVSTMDVTGRGRPLRHHASLTHGANANFVSRSRAGAAGWRIRTYERGVEGETLACGSGAAATAILLTAWGEAHGPVELETRSGRTLRVRLSRSGAAWKPSLAGEGRVVFHGILSEI
ncbi:MAG TPA: diaminopimelate epimerase [Gemmatimonadaceae bacterium]|nr:diaminopimelate epimerase [Gemmatimonadaceae bacterium]